MKRENLIGLIGLAAGAIALGGCCTCGTAEVHPDSSSWTPVFDKTLSNAEYKPGSWGYEADGCLVPRTGDSIFSKEDYENFVVDLEYAMGKAGNSGLFLYDTDHPKFKFEVQMMDDDDPSLAKELPYQKNGSIYGRAPARVNNARPAGEWNRMTVWCRGQKVRVCVNGVEQVNVDFADWKDALINPDGTRVPKWHEGFPALSTIPTHGKIGFQGVHGKTGVRIKYIRVKKL